MVEESVDFAEAFVIFELIAIAEVAAVAADFFVVAAALFSFAYVHLQPAIRSIKKLKRMCGFRNEKHKSTLPSSLLIL